MKRRADKKKKVFVRVGVLVVIIIILLFLINFPKEEAFQKGMCFVSWESNYISERAMESLDYLKRLNAEWISISPTWYQDTPDSVEIKRTRKTLPDEDLAEFIKIAHQKGFKIMLKPHIDILNHQSGSRVDIAFYNDKDWEEWFDNYTDMITGYAETAQKYGIEILCIGVELSGTTVDKGDLWKSKVIKSVREAYSGKITYAANWYEEYVNIEFWNELDYAGLDPYFPLTEKNIPGYEEILEGWKPHLNEIEEWADYIKKPVIFTEIGYHSADGAARLPFEWVLKTPVNLKLQNDCYKALIDTFKDKEWFHGIYWWYWYVNLSKGGERDRSFVIHKKPAEETVKEWYSKDIIRTLQ
ncbi:hypothetical protein M0R36_08385 [bacterium]|jgi:hypothetical protein|nr:hypothetical protein [bacterium]